MTITALNSGPNFTRLSDFPWFPDDPNMNIMAEFMRQAQLIHQAWPHNVREQLEVASADHLTVCDRLAEPESALFRATLDLVRSV